MTGEEVSSSTPETEETKERKIERANQLFQDGKRHLLSSNIPDASKMLADACQLFSELYEEFGVECGEVYLSYGKSLLELARLEPGVFSNALQGAVKEDDEVEVDEEEEEEEGEGAAENECAVEEVPPEEEQQFENPEQLTVEQREEIHEMVEDALEENAECAEKGELPPEEPQGEENGKEEPEKEALEPVVEEPDEGVPQEEKEDTDEVSNLQLAWEILDMARVIFKKGSGAESEQKLVECLLCLGEVSVEDENYERGKEDLQSCIELLKNAPVQEGRKLAEGYFQLGRCLNLAGKFSDAAEAFRSAVTAINSKIATTKEALTTCEDPEKKTTLEKEVESLESLIPDLQSKVEDALESAKSAEERKETLDDAATGLTDENPATAAADIGHLLRKPIKRPPQEDGECEETKKKKLEEANGDSNGHVEEAQG